MKAKLEYPYPSIVAKFNGSCLVKKDKFTFDKKVSTIYIFYELDYNSNSFHPKLKKLFVWISKSDKKKQLF